MGNAQSSPVPPPGTKPRLADLGWLTIYGLHGFVKLVQARIAFARFDVRDLLTRNQRALRADGPVSGDTPALVARIAYVIPRISARLPWRSDCLIQAMAAQDWLARHGLPSEIRIGVENPADGKFGAHAWLVHDDMVVTGGAVDRYDVLLESSSHGGF